MEPGVDKLPLPSKGNDAEKSLLHLRQRFLPVACGAEWLRFEPGATFHL